MRYLPVLLAAALGWLFCATGHAYEYENGSLKVSQSGYLDAKAVAPLHRDVPKEYPTTELGLECKATASTWGAAKLNLQAIQSGTVLDPENGKVFNQLDMIYQDRNPCIDVDEAYADFYSEKADLRIGIQKFSWGRLDELNPTDNINPEDFSQGTINEELERKIGIPAVKVSSYSDLVNLEMAWIPRYVPYRLPQPDEKWFPNPLKAPSSVQASGTTIPVTSQHDDLTMPDATLQNSEGAVRVSKYIGGWDLSASYYHGYDVMPVTDVYSDITVDLKSIQAMEYTISADLTYKPALYKMNVYGFDFTTTMGSFTVRGEGAYFDGRHFNRTMESVLNEALSKSNQQKLFQAFMKNYWDSNGALTRQTFRLKPQVNIPLDALHYGLGADYIYGDSSISMQVIQEYLPDYDSSTPVYFISDEGFNTMITVLFRQLYLQNTLELTLRGAYGIEFRDYLLKPSVKYSFTNNIQGTLGMIILGGTDEFSMFGQYDENDEIFAQLRCSF